MRVFLITMLAICAAVLAPQAQASWVEVESENFIFRGDVNPKDGEALVRDLETFRANVLRLVGTTGKPERVKVPLYSVKNKRMLKSVYGTDNIGGVYTTDFRGPIFLLSSQGGFGRGKEARYIAFHEYSHHLLAAYTEDHYPRWYNEGFANYLATFEYKKGQFAIGAPKQAYGPVLANKNWLPMKTILSSVTRYPFNFKDNSRNADFTRGLYYGQSWLMVHYIQNNSELSKNFTKYITALNAGEAALPAFEKTMGMSPEAFGKEVRAYHKKNRFGSAIFKSEFGPGSFEVSVKRISKEDGLRHLADVTLAFSANDTKFTRTRAAYDKAEKALGLTAPILVGRADMAMAEEDYDGAERLVAQALALEPDNLEAHRIGGASHIQRHKMGYGNVDNLVAGRKHLKAVLAQIPDDPSANYFYALSYSDRRPPPADAVASAKTALGYYRDNNFAGTNLSMAQVLMNAGDYDGAYKPVKTASIWGYDRGTRSSAKSMLSYIESQR